MAGRIASTRSPRRAAGTASSCTSRTAGALALRDKRRLGRARLEPDLDALGPDAAEIARDEFRARVGRGSAPLKARLMDQSVVSGVGNLLADEILWRARLDPRRPAGELSTEELDRLRRELRAATRAAMRRGGAHTGDVIAARRRARCARAAAPRWPARPSAAGRPSGARRSSADDAIEPSDGRRGVLVQSFRA